jgi:hypothetical protein
MSDCDKGSKKADTEIPLAHHVSCTEPLSRNINTLFSGGPREAFNTNVRQATTEASFRKGIQKLAAVRTRAVNYVDGNQHGQRHLSEDLGTDIIHPILWRVSMAIWFLNGRWPPLIVSTVSRTMLWTSDTNARKMPITRRSAP